MKKIILLVAIFSLAITANASDAKKAGRKPADESCPSQVKFTGPVIASDKTGELTITGEAADQLFAAMKVTASASGKMNGHSVNCTPANPPLTAHGHCEIYFDDVTNGTVQVRPLDN